MTNIGKYYTKEEWAVYMRNWRKKNKDKVKLANRKMADYRNERKKKLYHSDEEYRKKVNKSSVENNRKRNTGFTSVEYDIKYKEQQGCCALCGKHQFEITKALSADHCHTIGTKRGLLCGTCNTQLGYYEKFISDKDLVECFNQYLKMYK